ncbi:Sulfite exporter TauE/SafE [Geosporobacter subterraneus DSM 17957]|uniref:Probable membrane transporter protein n=1 Tax=Geosporobacter subterraneus DSM 17957 TaxID=1121919 RepID=A0A1M6MWL1_9FIRM|nr:sulfite exporter TauE/SafE family protein [Geosporobacter subterraneus]SHJ87861.1 Sulfite exporter TauE/SafE [Geosporobacter subterraneus DSM 17957]
MITGILGVLGLLTAWFSVEFAKDLSKNKVSLESETSFATSSAIGFTTNFFDTLGIGSFAPTTALLRGFKQIQDRVIPGTLNVSCTIPVVAEAFIFITVIEVEPVTLIGMLAAATLGAWLGAGIVSNLPEKKIQMGMAVALLITASLMFSGMMGWMPGGGDAIGLSGGKLIIAIVANFILGALMTLGIGMYAPCMALVYFLGMSPAVAFPIMMGSCAFLMPVASVKFVREGSYNRKASLAIAIFGLLGVFIAAYIVKSLPLNVLRWLVIGVILYTSMTMFKSASKPAEATAIK